MISRITDSLGIEIETSNFLHYFLLYHFSNCLSIEQFCLIKSHLFWMFCIFFFSLATRALYRHYSFPLPIQRAEAELKEQVLLWVVRHKDISVCVAKYQLAGASTQLRFPRGRDKDISPGILLCQGTTFPPGIPKICNSERVWPQLSVWIYRAPKSCLPDRQTQGRRIAVRQELRSTNIGSTFRVLHSQHSSKYISIF